VKAVTRLGQVASWALLVGAIYGAALVVGGFLAPVYKSTGVSSTGEVTHRSETLVDVNGLGVGFVLGLPLLITVVVGFALWQGSWRGAVPFAWALTGLLAAFNLLAMLSIGVFVLPATAALVVACSTSRTRPQHHKVPDDRGP
jgi:hypothetical protein